MKGTLKIGTNKRKGKAISRIWIEGTPLATHGWNKHDEFYVDWTEIEGKPALIYHKGTAPQGTQQRAVAGGDDRPVIDTCTNKIIEHFGCEYVEITVTKEKVTILPGKKPEKRGFRMIAAVVAAALALGSMVNTQFSRDAMRVLVACEESATVRDQFAILGHDVVSCDILDTRNPHGWHIKGDVTPYLDYDWDLVLAFPPCTYLTISAAYAFKDPDFDRYPGVGYHQRLKPGTLFGEARRKARDEAIEFVDLLYRKSHRFCGENPKGFLSSMWKKPTQIIQPNEFGHPESKETCLWLKRLKKLVPTNKLDIKEHGYLVESGRHAGKWRWQNQAPCGAPKMGPSADRAKRKSVTYLGVAQAMATQWGGRAA